jgi:hypothetical protein
VFKQWIAAKLFDVGAWLMMKASSWFDDTHLYEFDDWEDCE